MWAVCRGDHGLSWAEFEDLTFAQYEALEERRTIRIRHARFDAALIVSTLYNINRAGDMEYLSPLDFLPGFEEDEDIKRARLARKQAVSGVRRSLAMLPMRTTAEAVAALVVKIKAGLKAAGHEDADAIVTEAFPNL